MDGIVFLSKEVRMIRKATDKDLESILKIYATAREFMKKTGNPNQWGDSFPPRDMLVKDIAKGDLYILEEDNNICAVFAFILGEDPTYAYIEDGSWLSDKPYAAIHRVASDGSVHGVLKKAVEYASGIINHIRIDTHMDNKVMQHLIEKCGFKKCGIIYVEDGSPRIAYEMVNDEI